jgi:serine/threonine-protein kinase
MRCALIGLGLVLFVIGVDQLIKASRPSSPEPIESPGGSEEAVNPVPTRAVAPPPTRPVPPRKAMVANDERPNTAAPASWVEPTDPAPGEQSVAEEDYGLRVESRFVPAWAAAPVRDRLADPSVTVRRVPDSPSEQPNLRLALDALLQPAGTVELADDGPFFEHGLHVTGDSRLVRARPGYRPIVAVTPRRPDFVRRQPAVVVLDGKNLTLDGLDLVVNVESLPDEQTALFLCRGAELTIQNCTVTVVNPKQRPFTVVRTGAGASPRPSRVRLETTFLRGQGVSLLELGAGSTEAVVSRSVAVTGPAPAFSWAAVAGAGDRQVSLTRSLFAVQAPVFNVGVPTAGPRPRPLSVRALGTTFACVQGANPSSLIASREPVGPNDLVQWSGESNVFAGWNAWVATGADYAVKLGDLPAARRLWPSSDTRSQEVVLAWPSFTALERVVPGELSTLAPTRQATLVRVPSPSPYLLEKTVRTFDRPPVPDLAPPRPGAPAAAVGQGGGIRGAFPGVTAGGPYARSLGTSKPAPKAALKKAAGGEPAAPDAEGELSFNAAAPPWNGDLGLFLRGRNPATGSRVRVRVIGIGAHICTPIRMPDGVSLEVTVDAPRAGGALSWSPAPGADAEALFDVRGADLVLSGVVLNLDASARPKALVRVEGGHLVLDRCRLLSPGVAEDGGGGLIAFRAPGSRPLPAGAGPFATPVDRPVCRLTDCVLITGGVALSAEVGRGLVALTQCALAAGRSALELRPSKVARARFEADLVLDHCTLASSRDFVRLGRWDGSAPGPDRPWLVASRDSAFVSYFTGAPRDAVLLRADTGSLAHGSLFWQGHNDAYDVPHFTAGGDAPPAPNSRSDLQHQWVDLWGPNHIRRATGHGKGSTTPSVRFLERLRPGDVAPDDLVLDPNPAHLRDRKTLDLGADPRRLGLTSPRPR